MNNDKKALKSGLWYTVANFFMRSIGLITTPIFTRLLSHEEFGLYNNYTSWLGILTICITLNLESTFISARYDHEDDFDGYISSVLALSTISVLSFAMLLNLFYVPMQHILGMRRLYLNCMMTYLAFLPAVNMFQSRERYLFRYKISVLLSLLVSIGTAALSVLLVTIMNDRLQGRIFGSAIPTICIGVVLYFLIMHYGHHVRTAYWKYAFHICLPFIPHLLSMNVLNSVDRIMITRICGAEQNALYSLAYTCGSMISILIVSMNTAFSPWLGQKLHEGGYKDIRQFARKYITLFTALAGAIMIFTPEVLFILGGKSYQSAIYVMPPVACGCIFQFLYTMFVNVEQFSKKVVGMAFASASAALLNYILNALFIPKYGYIAAAYTTLAGFAWLLTAHMILVRRIGLKEVYPYRFILGTAMTAIAVAIAVNALYRVPFLRWGIGIVYITIILGVIWKYKETVLKMFRRG